MKTNRGEVQNILRRIDLYLLLPALFLVLISLSSLFSINIVFFRQQLVSFALGLLFFIFFLNIDLYMLKSLSKLIYILIIVVFVLLILLGVEVSGERNWFDLFGLRIQVAEIAKPFFLIVLASYLFTEVKQKMVKFFGAVLLILPIIFLITRSDFGTGIIYAMSSFMVFTLAKFQKRYILGSILVFVATFPIAFNFLAEYQKQRITTFLDVTSDPTGASYNAIQSLISIGSGGVTGKGFGQGTQSLLRFLPEQHTDFIFATISEDLGFVGSFVVLILFVALLYRIYKVAQWSGSQYEYLICMGVFGIFFFQILFNIGMNLGLMPIIGITLPFVSYGGNSLVASFISLSLVSIISTNNKKQQSMEIS